MRNRALLWVGLGTGLVLLIPLLAMQFTSQVNWSVTDFVVMGVLVFGAGSVYALIAGRSPRRRRVVAGAVLAAGFLYLWAELAVGIFTSWGS